MCLRMPVPPDSTLEKEKDSKESARYSIRHVLHKIKPYFKYHRAELLTQKIDKEIIDVNIDGCIIFI